MVNDTPASSLASVLEPRLDVAAFLRYVAAQNFVAENDGFAGYDGMNNFYFYRLEDSTRHVFVAWDEDNAFLTPDFALTTRHEENVLMRKVMESRTWRAQYLTHPPGGRGVGRAGRRRAGRRLAAGRDAAAARSDRRRDAGGPVEAVHERRARGGAGRAARLSCDRGSPTCAARRRARSGSALPAGCS